MGQDDGIKEKTWKKKEYCNPHLYTEETDNLSVMTSCWINGLKNINQTQKPTKQQLITTTT